MIRTEILPANEPSIARAAERLRGGGIVGMPTETVYGLAAIARDEAAVASVFAAKERPTFDPLIVHVAVFESGAGEDAVSHLSKLGLVDERAMSKVSRARAVALARALWPGPLTMVLPRGAAIPDLVTAGLATVAVRMPRHPVAQALIAQTGFPLAAPSANRFGHISPTSAADVVAELGGRIELILDGGPCQIGLESTVVALPPDDPPLLLRPGGISREAIESLIGPVTLAGFQSVRGSQSAASPGTLASHYAPAKPLSLLSGPAMAAVESDFATGKRGALGLLIQSGDPAPVAARIEALTGRHVIACTLSERGDTVDAARHLFARLRELDRSPAVALFAEPCSDESGLGFAIADRLRRAAVYLVGRR